MSLNPNLCCVSLLTLCWPDPKVSTPTYCQAISSGLHSYKQEKFLTLKSPILIIGNHLTLLGEGSPVFRRVLPLIPPLNVGGGGRKLPRLTTYSRNIVAKIIWRAHNDTTTQTSSSESSLNCRLEPSTTAPVPMPDPLLRSQVQTRAVVDSCRLDPNHSQPSDTS